MSEQDSNAGLVKPRVFLGSEQGVGAKRGQKGVSPALERGGGVPNASHVNVLLLRNSEIFGKVTIGKDATLSIRALPAGAP
jgi:hypothetical protein